MESIEVFNTEFKPKMTEADVLAMLAMSTEVRPVYPCSVAVVPSLTVPCSRVSYATV